jgi:AraC-like DNA-binding protein
MIFSKQLKSWYTKFQKYKVTYKDGFFHLFNLANSPYTIVETFNNMPFCKHNLSQKLITAKTPFLNAQLYYAELEQGLWIFVSDLEFKKNVAMKNIYDETLPINYNFINLHYSKKKFESKSMLINGMILSDKTWSIFKAGNANEDFHFKDSHENNITIYFTNEWLAKQQCSNNHLTSVNLARFFESDNTYFFLPDTFLTSDDLYQTFLDVIKHNGDYAKNKKLTKGVVDFFKHFIDKCMHEEISEDHFKIPGKDRKRIQEAEKYLLDNILTSFPGIENVAEKVGISPTKLKNDFKTIHNQTVYNYYRYHQMDLAYKLICEKAQTVKEVATLLGYENASKFAAVFKEQFGVQPSSLLKEQNV